LGFQQNEVETQSQGAIGPSNPGGGFGQARPDRTPLLGEQDQCFAQAGGFTAPGRTAYEYERIGFQFRILPLP
jgi:hypothetical protein